jgi:exonuclease SbcD
MVELEKHGDSPIVRTISIQNPHPLVTIPTDGAAEWNEVIRQLKDFPDDIPAYIRLNVEVTDFLPPESRFEAMAITEKKAARFCLINTKRKQKEESDKRIFTIAEFQKQRPIDIAQQYIEDLGMTFDEELKRMFQEVERTVNENEREINQD